MPPILAMIPGFPSSIKFSTNHSLFGISPFKNLILNCFKGKPRSKISFLTTSKPCSWCKSLKSPTIEGNLTTVLLIADVISSAFFWPIELESLSKQIKNFALVSFLRLVKAVRPKFAENTQQTARFVASNTEYAVASPSTIKTWSKSCHSDQLKPTICTLPLTSLALTNLFSPFLSMYCSDLISGLTLVVEYKGTTRESLIVFNP